MARCVESERKEDAEVNRGGIVHRIWQRILPVHFQRYDYHFNLGNVRDMYPYTTPRKYSHFRYSEVCRRILLARDKISEWIIESHPKPHLARRVEAHGILIDRPQVI